MSITYISYYYILALYFMELKQHQRREKGETLGWKGRGRGCLAGPRLCRSSRKAVALSRSRSSSRRCGWRCGCPAGIWLRARSTHTFRISAAAAAVFRADMDMREEDTVSFCLSEWHTDTLTH